MVGGTGTMRTLQNHIGGEWVESSAGDYLELTNPATAEPLCRVPLSTARDVDQAVAAARAAFPAWRAVPPVVRARHLFRLKHVLDQRFDEIAAIITRENGKTLDEARGSLRRGIENVEHACGIPTLMMGRALEDVAAGIDCEYVRQPLGVFTAITPFNFPAMVPMWFWPYAIAAGNTFILKPSEQVPLTATRIAELAHEAGFPPGVLNLVHGGKEAVQALLEHPDVAGISFVGSSAVARHVYEEAAKHLRLGYGLDADVTMGPLVSGRHKERVLSYVEAGRRDGAELLLDGRATRVERYPRGHFVGPTVFDAVRPEMTIGREEIFGPVASVTRVADLDEAIDVIQRSSYGNATSIFTTSGRAAREFRYRVGVSMIGVNLGIAAPMAFFPFGGTKGSFFGDLKAHGQDAIEFYTDKKVVISRW